MASKKSKKKKKEKEEEKEIEEMDEELDEEMDEEDEEEGQSFYTNPKVIYGFVILAVVVFVLWQIKGLFVVAMVNNQPITRVALIQELEDRYGEEILDNMITQQLVKQAAAEQGVTVSEEEINEEIENIRGSLEQQGSTLEDALAMQGQTEENLREGVELSIMVEKLFEDEIDISEEDVREYYEQNKELYGEDSSFEELQGQLREQMVQQQLSGQFNQWLQNRREEAQIRRFVDF